MTSKDRVLERERSRGRAAALDLAGRAVSDGLNGTALIAEQDSVPAWREDAVYTYNHIGFPIQDGDQVFKILQPHTPAHNPGFRPVDLPAIYSITHTKDPKRAKPYVAPNGTSGMYMAGDCCVENGAVWRSLNDNNVWSPSAYPSFWEEVRSVE